MGNVSLVRLRNNESATLSTPSRTMSAAQPPLDIDTTKSSVDQDPLSPVDEAKDKLDKLLAHGATEKELVEKNIMKDHSKVAPALQGVQAELQRKQTADKLDQAISHRPPPEELVKEGILPEDEAPPADKPLAALSANPPS